MSGVENLVIRGRLVKWCVFVIAFSAVLAIGGRAWYIVFGSNFHTVVAGECYRSNQPSAEEICAWQTEYGIRTIINLRGRNEKKAWYRAERCAAERCGLRLVDIDGCFSQRPLRRAVLCRLMRELDQATPPILVHCAGGVHRSGLAAAVYLLLHGSDVDAARGELSFWHGYLPTGKHHHMKDVVEAYALWLEQQGWPHTPGRFRHWVRQIYRVSPTAGDCWQEGGQGEKEKGRGREGGEEGEKRL